MNKKTLLIFIILFLCGIQLYIISSRSQLRRSSGNLDDKNKAQALIKKDYPEFDKDSIEKVISLWHLNNIKSKLEELVQLVKQKVHDKKVRREIRENILLGLHKKGYTEENLKKIAKSVAE